MSEILRSKGLEYFERLLEIPQGGCIDVTPYRGDLMRLSVVGGFGEVLIDEVPRSVGPGDVMGEICGVTCIIRADSEQASSLLIEREYI